MHVVSHTSYISLYKRLQGFVSKYALMHIAQEFDWVKHVDIDSEHCGCLLGHTHDLPCACKLAIYDLGCIPLNKVHVM